MPKHNHRIECSKRYLDSGTMWGSAGWATASCLEAASSPLSVLFLLSCEVRWFNGASRGLWGNCTPALWTNI